ncbi:MAG TPA: hypothetical protein VLG36_01415 [Candidatus Chromulinivoraceae bacterium]|nr:hypothetical protein [Candidatus Chromulinivoraceae bacterium]
MAMASDLRLLLKYYLSWSILLFVGIVVLHVLGVMNGGDVVQKVDGIEIVSHSLGFGNPNGAFTYLFSILITGYVLLGSSSRNKILFTTLALVSIIIIYNQTLSRTGLLCCLLVIAFGHFNKAMSWRKIKRVLPILFILLTLGSVFLAMHNNQMGDNINDLMSNRPYWWGIRVEDGELSNLLGNADSFATNYAQGQDSAPLDSFFLRIWFRNGLLILLVFFVFFRLWSKRLQNRMLVLGTLVTLLYGFSEYGIMSNPGRNVVLLIMMVPIFSKYAVSQKMNLFVGDTFRDK